MGSAVSNCLNSNEDSLTSLTNKVNLYNKFIKEQ